MADTTETSVVQVTLLDAMGFVKTLNIDNPKQNLSLNTIRAAFQPAINGGWLYGRSAPVVEVQKANYSTSTKIPISGGIVEVTPSSLEMNTRIGSVVVTGAVPTAAYIIDMEYSAPSDWDVGWRMPTIDIDSGTITVVLVRINGSGSATVTGTAKLIIYFSGGTVAVPISFQASDL